jgi:hypothetical protein
VVRGFVADEQHGAGGELHGEMESALLPL